MLAVDPETRRCKLVELIGYAQRRVERAQERKGRADLECEEACAQLAAARANLADWDEQHPDPQMALI